MHVKLIIKTSAAYVHANEQLQLRFLCLNPFVCSSQLFTEVDLNSGAGYLQSHGCTLALTNSHDTVSQMINWRTTKWNKTNDFKSSMISSARLHLMCVLLLLLLLLLFCCVFFFFAGGGGDLTRYSKNNCNLILICFTKNCKILTVK